MHKHKNYLITGGCGFIGRNLIRHLTKREGINIRIVDNYTIGTPDDIARFCEYTERSAEEFDAFPVDGTVEVIKGDIRDADLAIKACTGADVIIHLAANAGVPNSVANPRFDMEHNVVGIFNYLEGARENDVKSFIFASSAAPVGETTPPVHEELCPHPVSPYGASKLAGEGYCSAYARTFGIQTVALRFGNVYGIGSGHKSSVVAKFIRQASNGETLEIYGDGTQTRDYIFIDDLIEAILLSTEVENIGGEVFQIATASETTLNELVDHMLPLLAEAGIQDVNVIHGEKRLGDIQRNFSDTSKAKDRLGWHAKTGLKDGLKVTIKDVLNSLKQSKAA